MNTSSLTRKKKLKKKKKIKKKKQKKLKVEKKDLPAEADTKEESVKSKPKKEKVIREFYLIKIEF